MREGKPHRKMSFGPIDEHHLGLSTIQAKKLQNALGAGVRFMRELNWMGLPAPKKVRDSTNFVSETIEERRNREGRQIEVFARIDARGVGKAAFTAAGGWNLLSTTPADDKQFRKACAEWADGDGASGEADSVLISYFIGTKRLHGDDYSIGYEIKRIGKEIQLSLAKRSDDTTFQCFGSRARFVSSHDR